MRKFAAFWVCFCCITGNVWADHITGGEMYYTYAGVFNGLHQYRFTMKLYMRCNSGRSFNNPTIISVFNRGTGERQFDMNVPLSSQETIQITNPDPCISNPPEVCYDIGYYNFTVALAGNLQGYIVAGQVNFRISGIANLSPGYSQIGATYSAEIPGTAGSPTHLENNSARFVGSDLVIVCANNPFSYSFAAQDADNDGLNYDFCEAYRSNTQGGGGGGGGNAIAPQNPPFESVPYGNGYNGNIPLGSPVTIDRNTGLISGIAPPSGVYVVTVCVTESRNGRVIAVQRKDLQIAIASCNLTAATLLPEYMLCRDTKTITLANLSLSSLVTSYDWEFRNQSGGLVYSTSTATATHSFVDTGTYTVKLLINKNDRCSDSTTALIRVYPGFKPDFDYAGVCINKPTLFTDKTTTVYGVVNGWNWTFDDNVAITANTRNAGYTYTASGEHFPRLIATNSKGCRDTLVKPFQIVDRPPVLLAFKDTIICVNDPLQLMANGNGNYTWTPNTQIINANTATPTVTPLKTTTYIANLNDNGCLNTDSVRVRVTDHVDLVAMNDTTICAGDAIQLRIVSNGLKYAWSPASQLNDATIANPLATTAATSDYEITANIGSCVAKDHVIVTTVPYPNAYAGLDTSICFGGTATLHGQSSSPSFKWSPANSLSSATVLEPKATPFSSTSYVLSVYEFEGCPKPGQDTVLVAVLPDINATAGPDTSVVIGEEVQLYATGGTGYQWSPPNGLSASNIAKPIATYSEPYDLLTYRVLVFNGNCQDSAFVRIKVFSTMPTVFVPNAFTPNGDGNNDVLKPIAVGMKSIEYFTIYNRYGQMIFTTTANGPGYQYLRVVGKSCGLPGQSIYGKRHRRTHPLILTGNAFSGFA
jgi:hypothetical protein